MKIKKALLGVALLVGTMGAANAQQSATEPCGDPSTTWNWGDNKPAAQEKNALYNDEMKLGNFRKSANALSWLLKNTPTLNPAIYINGATIYDELATAEADAKKKRVYQDSVMTLYDLRIKYYCNEAENAERKAFYAYKYYAADKERLPVLYNSLKRTAELNKENMSYANAVYFMDAIRRSKPTNKELTDEKVLDYYEVISQSLKNALEKNPDQAEQINKFREMVDNMLVGIVNVDCKFVEKNFGPKLKQNPTDVDLAKKVFKLLSIGKCTDTPLYASTLKQIYQSEKTFEMAKYMAIKAIQDKNYSEANQYLNDAISLAKTNQDKGDLLLMQAQLAAQRGAKSEARSLAYKAIEADAGQASKAYSMIGNLYFGSQECNKQVSRVEDRAIYIAAYEMYQKAGDSSGMNKAKSQFPSKGELFDENKQPGESYKVGCWIGETVTLRTRD